ncbi:Lytic transglycosylase with a strong preference for naked glycan strands that lack stem peptides [Vibrio sp. B1FLJ16]|nr:Lytic transglycosylase with a strong preference for naked glycan strands that lack stem peptides [Vibrio sp. B1FLJ16]CAD7819722.1 Lytic transglycosylase with a strong preference for naked glycan strands that lack stem peptides [Vibrio sp. B1FLJ16]CAE6936415.1 Lytic transglycosylase with a strong preference for naked glycan strands that lack stem peptides [Vibrio sp. B1FLJ16]CAE6940243.1 Lytic transglycosylase with a strong preference for naked glycan strands that lack stem peptides [Vibrio sp
MVVIPANLHNNLKPMKRLNLIFIAFILNLLAGCSSTLAVDLDQTNGYSKSHELIGKASWYSNKFHGKRTASGERYNKSAYTAAHKSLPFGTIVRVTNTANSKTVDVKINDRGPFVKGRVIDLSQKAFEQIGNIKEGVAPVKIEIINDTNTFRYKH